MMLTAVTDRIRIPWTPDLDMDKIVVAHARSIVGVGADVPETRAVFEDLLGPPPKGGRWDIDRPYRCVRGPDGRYVTQGVSTCALVVAGIWRWCGVDAPWLHQPYVIGSAVSRIVGFAQRARAWQGYQRHYPPPPGSCVVMGHGLSTHVMIVVDVDGDVVTSVDGGQIGARGLQCIRARRRRWTKGALDGHEVQGWVDPMLLPYRGDVMVPEGWEWIAV